MSERENTAQMLEAAEHAAMDGDFTTADALLRDAARTQEADLGPLHPDLARTLNNLAIVAEKTDRPDDAEQFYRRAAMIAAASLPPDHPMIEASRKNLADFCHDRGLPIDVPESPTPMPGAVAPLGLHSFSREDAGPPAAPAGAIRTAADADLIRPESPAPAASTPPTAPPKSAAVPSLTSEVTVRSPARPMSRRLAWVAIAAVVVVAAVLMATRPGPDDALAGTATAPGPSQTPATAPAAPQSAAPSSTTPESTTPARSSSPPPPPPVAPASPPATGPGEGGRGAAGASAAGSEVRTANAGGAVTLAAAQVCRSFSTSGSNWRCDPAGDTVPAGPLVLYTRVRTPRDAAVVHRWYRGDALVQAVTLNVRANAAEGYRTYSRQTVAAGTAWRVEVRSRAGDLLHEQRFAVR